MAANPRRLRPTEVCRLLNSTPLGEVISERQLHRHRTRAGARIGDGRTIDLLRYTAWLVSVRHEALRDQPTDEQAYERLRERSRSRNAEIAKAGRDIGSLPEVVDPERKARASRNFQFFCESYFPSTFHLAWSRDHLTVLRRIEQAVLRGGLFAMAMPRGSGKALALDTPLPTPFGWTTMGDVQVGDFVYDEEGWPCEVTFATEVQFGRPCFRVAFSDGEAITCDAEHLWSVEDCGSRRNPLVLSTQEMRERVTIPRRPGKVERRLRVPLTKPLRAPEANLPIDPYVLGCRIGGGSRGSDRIPGSYLRAAPWQRLALLQGIMDTDGHIAKKGTCEITLKDDLLGRDLGELLSTLGIKWKRQEKWVTRDGRRLGPYLRYHFTAYDDFPVFRLSRKRDLLCQRPRGGGMPKGRQIDSIEPVPSVPVRCIQVNSLSQLYLAGRKMVPTHNTTICECACIWAVLNGHREFVSLIGSDEGHAMDMLDSIKTELDGNELLLADYPEVVFPIVSLDGIANRCKGQLYKGERTHIGWTAREVVLPTIESSPASGAIIKVAGITGRIRGMKSKTPDGRSLRPSLVVLDDPQTDESARSLSQCATREGILAGAILGLAGPGRKISGIMPCTVIRPGDMADNILNRDKHPEWNGERTKMVYSFPTNEKLWQEYADIRAESLRLGNDGVEATRFYAEHRETMDQGARVAWPERFNHDELSAVQHAMNLRLQDEAAFYAEYQNEPLAEASVDSDELTSDQIAAKINRLDRGLVPIAATRVTMFVDVQATLLYYLVAAWEDNFTGYVIDYGTYPDQHRPYFTLRDARVNLSHATGINGLEGSIYSGLDRLTNQLLAREWQRDDGAMLRVEKCLVDANWGSSTDVVYQFCRQSAHAGIILPSHGRFVGAAGQPFSEYRKRPGDQIGLNWRVPSVQGKRAVRHVLYDTNFWKSFVMARLVVPMGERGCLSLFGADANAHRLLAEHLSAEYRVKTEGRGRTVDEWKLRPERSDNHWLDGLVGSAVAASILGVSLDSVERHVAKSPGRISFREMQRKRRD